MTASELRTKFLEFFKSKGHTIIPSASVVPLNDPTVLFTTAGMHPLVPYLLGENHPEGRRLANIQKCIRTVDIDNVGDETHVTFIEMLGNWSLGDPASPDGVGADGYFKKEAIEMSWEFLTGEKGLNINPKYLAFTCFGGDKRVSGILKDEESAKIWMSQGVLKERILFLSGGVLEQEDNWWGPAGQTGPCGPSTEMFYWSEHSIKPPKKFDPKDERWVEIWNDVFMQFNKTAEGKFEPLKQKNVDTGMGFDRMLAMMNGQRSVFDTELFKPLWQVLELSQSIMTNDEVKRARVVLDHVRASVFIAADGIEPSNKDHGYVLRRLLRRAMVYAKLLNLKSHWLKALAGRVISVYSNTYPELVDRSEKIIDVLLAEEKKFGKTLEKGLKEFGKFMQITTPSVTPSSSPPRGGGQVSGKDAFYLYQSYGFPWELTAELSGQSGVEVNKKEFEEEFKKHQTLSRTASAGKFRGGLADHTEEVIRLHTATHLLNAALRKVLGKHVWQKGSNITKERSRFDFTHPAKMTNEEKQKVESLVNTWIKADYLVKKEVMSLSEAEKLGAIGVFGEKYPERVNIYTVYDPKTEEVISREFCGGPHVENTRVIGKFKIIKEEASSAGVRRIKASIENS